MSGLVIRQGGLRFHWNRDRHITIRQPSGAYVDELTVSAGRFPDGATLDEIHDAIDSYVELGDWTKSSQ